MEDQSEVTNMVSGWLIAGFLLTVFCVDEHNTNISARKGECLISLKQI
jgi:hypothetical protein